MPKSVTEIRSFLGYAGYRRTFIQGLSSIMVPMTASMKKNYKFILVSERQESFDQLKQALTTAPILAMPSGQGEFVVYTYASKLDLGAVLMQHDRVIAYASRKLKVHENNYLTHDLELAVMVFALKIWRHYLKHAVIAHFSVQRPLQAEIQIFELAVYVRRTIREGDSYFGDLLRAFMIDFQGSCEPNLPLVEFTYNNSYQALIGMAPYKALYGRKCRSPVHWDEVGERAELGPVIVKQTAELVIKIQDRMRTAQSRQKSYADHRRRDLEFAVWDHIFMKVAPMKGVMRFEKKVKRNPRFIGPFEILERVGTLAYRVALPSNLARVHNLFPRIYAVEVHVEFFACAEL
ncbi:uncharacterized protein [Primulina huaijiensis]|uniref:uncharacterized protein n=1 Tax=Primulina huaijiensis TaxID=1492673 RepID=UPI003CC6EADF